MASPYSANERPHSDPEGRLALNKNSDLLRWSCSCPPLRGGLGDLAQKAKSVDGYAIQIEGYASAVGSEAARPDITGN